MAEPRPQRKRPAPLDREKLRALALSYVGRYATTRHRLGDYLRRKLRERGWAGEQEADVATLVADFAALSYVDDEAFASNRAASLLRRGYGPARVRANLGQSGIEREQIAVAAAVDIEQEREAALIFAKRKRIGPFRQSETNPREREKAMAAMLRAGHGFDLAREIVNALHERD